MIYHEVHIVRQKKRRHFPRRVSRFPRFLPPTLESSCISAYLIPSYLPTGQLIVFFSLYPAAIPLLSAFIFVAPPSVSLISHPFSPAGPLFPAERRDGGSDYSKRRKLPGTYDYLPRRICLALHYFL